MRHNRRSGDATNLAALDYQRKPASNRRMGVPA